MCFHLKFHGNFHHFFRSRTYVKHAQAAMSGVMGRKVGKAEITKALRRGKIGSARTRARFAKPGFSGAFAPVRSKPETNAIDSNVGTTAVPIQATATPPAAALVLLNSIAAGDDINMRDGRELTIKSVELRGVLANALVASQTAPSLARVLIVYDSSPNGAQPAVIDILADVSSTAHSDTNPAGLNFNNLNNRGRFKILAQETCSFGNVALATNAEQETAYAISMYRKVNLPVVFSGIAAGIGSITKGAVFALIVGTTNAASAAHIVFFGQARVRFQG